MANPSFAGFRIPNILLPKSGTNLKKWAVIACDQYTSEPEYWDAVEKEVGDDPSTFNMILPEVYLETPREAEKIKSTHSTMKQYLSKGIFEEHNGMIYVERISEGRMRKGIMLCLDLEAYDYAKGSQTLIRATEGTVIERLPPRIRIRDGAPLELPHILVLIDDPEDTVIGPIGAIKNSLLKLYDTELMQGSGQLSGFSIATTALHNQVAEALTKLADVSTFQNKYGVLSDKGVLLFAMGDGNHSLATAKSIWESKKQSVGMNHPSRYALVEIENVHDKGLIFEPIHRVLFNVTAKISGSLSEMYGENARILSCKNKEEMLSHVYNQTDTTHIVGKVSSEGYEIIEFTKPSYQLAVGTLQAFLDTFLKNGNAGHIDYVHGDDITCQLGAKSGNVGFILPGMAKADLFKTVIMDGVLPRKTFSMGHAAEKRFYMECRKIV